MSDDEQVQFSDLEGSVVEEEFAQDDDNKKVELYDPTGQYANGKLSDESSQSAHVNYS